MFQKQRKLRKGKGFPFALTRCVLIAIAALIVFFLVIQTLIVFPNTTKLDEDDDEETTTQTKTDEFLIKAALAIGVRGGEGDEWKQQAVYEALCSDIKEQDWINFLVLAPSTDFIDQHLLRALHSIAEIKIADKICNIRVIIVLGGKSVKEDITKLVNEWTEIHSISVEIISAPFDKTSDSALDSMLKRLKTGLKLIEKQYPNDLVYTLDSQCILPLGFTAFIRKEVIKSETVFMPQIFELTPNASKVTSGWWSKPSKLTLTNVGFYISDATSRKLYSSIEYTPLIALTSSVKATIRKSGSNGLKLSSPKVHGLIRPHTSFRTNEVIARKSRERDEMGLNRRPKWEEQVTTAINKLKKTLK